MSLEYFYHGFKFKDMLWTGKGAKGTHRAKRWLQFLMEGIVSEFVRAYFYVTETSNSGKQIVYFHKHTWVQLEQVALQSDRMRSAAHCAHVSDHG